MQDTADFAGMLGINLLKPLLHWYVEKKLLYCSSEFLKGLSKYVQVSMEE